MLSRLALGLGLVVLAAAVGVELVVRDFGFPDGHVTELERAYAELWRAWGVPVVVLGIDFLALAYVGRRRSVRAWWLVSAVVLVVLVLLATWTGLDLRGRLDDGGGG